MNFEIIPPHNEAAEAQLLGAMLIDEQAAQIAIEELAEIDFYTPKNRQLYQHLKKCFLQHHNLDELFVVAYLTEHKALEGIGGKERLAEVIMAAPSAAGVETWADLIKKASLDRECLKHAHALYQAAQCGRGGEVLESLGLTSKADEAQASVLDLVQYDTANDQNNLIGQRWLCRGGAALIIGQSGLGKSSLKVQCEVSMALGLDFFGMQPTRPLKVLSIQAENDTGDQAEQLKGVLNGLQLSGRVHDLNRHLSIFNETVRTGEQFIGWIANMAKRSRPDLIVIDPILSYIGGDISSQEVCSKFFRNGLNPISKQTGCAWVIIHHTGKPPKEQQIKQSMQSGDMSYLGLGSSELTNWARAILILAQTEGGYFLQAAKRGRRAGLQDDQGQEVRDLYLKHAEHGIFWERQPENYSNESEVGDLIYDALDLMNGENYKRKDMLNFMKKAAGVGRQALYKNGKVGRALERFLTMCRLPNMPGFYSKNQAFVAVGVTTDGKKD